MKQLPKAVAMFCAAELLTIASLVCAQPPTDKSKKGSVPQPSTAKKDQPKVAVIANVQVNISTWINLGPASATAQSPPQRKPESGKEASASDFLPALEKASQGGSGVVVLTNVNVDVSTWLNIGPSSDNAPPGIKQKQKTPAEKKPAPVATDNKVSVSAPGGPDDLFELHFRARRNVRGIDVLLAGTVPGANGAAAAAERINQLKATGTVGLLVLPLIVNTNPDTIRALRTAVGSVKAEASGARLSVTASIPDEAAAAARDVFDAAIQFVKGLLGQK